MTCHGSEWDSEWEKSTTFLFCTKQKLDDRWSTQNETDVCIGESLLSELRENSCVLSNSNQIRNNSFPTFPMEINQNWSIWDVWHPEKCHSSRKSRESLANPSNSQNCANSKRHHRFVGILIERPQSHAIQKRDRERVKMQRTKSVTDERAWMSAFECLSEKSNGGYLLTKVMSIVV